MGQDTFNEDSSKDRRRVKLDQERRHGKNKWGNKQNTRKNRRGKYETGAVEEYEEYED